MKKSVKFLFSLISGLAVSFSALAVEQSSATDNMATTRRDAVIFKVHDISPVSEEGIVTGCDFSVTLYNRTAINFRSFSINLQWDDVVDQRFNFDKYVEAYVGPDGVEEQKKVFKDDKEAQPVQISINVNAFGADKQISVRSHIDSEKCYLLLQQANYTVSPCDIVRSIDAVNNQGLEEKSCTDLFQYVNISNPEYFGQFKKMTATEIANQQKAIESQDLSDIDVVINKIVENLGNSDKALTDIN